MTSQPLKTWQWLVIAAGVAIALLAGCAHSSPPPTDSGAVLTETSDRIAAAMAHNATMGRKIHDAPKSPVDELRATVELQRQALEDGKAAERAAVAQFARQQAREHQDAVDAQNKYAALRADRWVSAALWLKHLVYVVLVLWAVAGVAGLLLTAFGGGVWFTIGRHLLALLPLANLFTSGSHLVQRKWGGT